VVIGVVIAAAFLLLLATFRSPLLALKAAVLNLLSIGASYGVPVAVFQWGGGSAALGVSEKIPIESYVPMMMFAIVFGLSMDYEVFLLSRIREGWTHTLDNHARIPAARGVHPTTMIGLMQNPGPWRTDRQARRGRAAGGRSRPASGTPSGGGSPRWRR
jgi:uncharacterized membrane protein YdfJ with MMPL/SSD domain